MLTKVPGTSVTENFSVRIQWKPKLVLKNTNKTLDVSLVLDDSLMHKRLKPSNILFYYSRQEAEALSKDFTKYKNLVERANLG